MSDIIFVNGLSAKKPGDKAPDYIIANLSIKRDDLIAFLQSQKGEWLNAVIKESKGGNWYIALDTWKRVEMTNITQKDPKTREITPQQATEISLFKFL